MKTNEAFQGFLDGVDDFTPLLDSLGEVAQAAGEVHCTRCNRMLKNVHMVAGVPFGPVCVNRIKHFMEMTVDDLREIARANEVEYKKMKKNDLVKVALLHDDTSEWTANWNGRFEDDCRTYGWKRVVESRKVPSGRLYLSKVEGGYTVSLIDLEGAIIEENTTEKYEEGVAIYKDRRDQLIAEQSD